MGTPDQRAAGEAGGRRAEQRRQAGGSAASAHPAGSPRCARAAHAASAGPPAPFCRGACLGGQFRLGSGSLSRDRGQEKLGIAAAPCNELPGRRASAQQAGVMAGVRGILVIACASPRPEHRCCKASRQPPRRTRPPHTQTNAGAARRPRGCGQAQGGRAIVGAPFGFGPARPGVCSGGGGWHRRRRLQAGSCGRVWQRGQRGRQERHSQLK